MQILRERLDYHRGVLEISRGTYIGCLSHRGLTEALTEPPHTPLQSREGVQNYLRTTDE